jgi:hypothetical protein
MRGGSAIATKIHGSDFAGFARELAVFALPAHLG